jgi:hypothetical protein
MGAVALAILWVNALLIAAAAGQQVRLLLRRRAAMRPRAAGERGEGLWRLRVARGEEGAIAAHRIEQVGHALEGAQAIAFHDRQARGEILGGTLEAPDGSAIALARAADAEVWVAPDEIARAARCNSPAAFARALAAAGKARGFTRTVEVAVGAGREVYVHGRLDGGTLRPTAAGTLLVATVDPRPVLARKAALAAAFLVAELLVAAACTAVALWPPVFGRVSTAGGVLCLAFFLLVQPAGTAVRDAVRVPSRAIVRGRWAQPS